MDTLFLLFPRNNEHTQKILSLEWPEFLSWGLRPIQSLRKSLELIFVRSDIEARDNFRYAVRNIMDVSPRYAAGYRRLDEYKYFRDRLLILYREVYKSQPETWHQLVRDDRNPQQYWTFWLALWILFLTVVSTISGLVSMATGIVSMQLAQEQARAPQQTIFCEVKDSSNRP